MPVCLLTSSAIFGSVSQLDRKKILYPSIGWANAQSFDARYGCVDFAIERFILYLVPIKPP